MSYRNCSLDIRNSCLKILYPQISVTKTNVILPLTQELSAGYQYFDSNAQVWIIKVKSI